MQNIDYGKLLMLVLCRWVKTENGQNFADSIGVKEPPMSLEDSVMGVLKQVSASFLHAQVLFSIQYLGLCDGTDVLC